MEKRKPHHSLPEVQAHVADPKSRPFTKTALDGGRMMGLTEREMRKVVCAMTRADFYKAMTAYNDSAVWQDVYHTAVPNGEVAYVKITAHADGRPPVIQFKAR